MHAYNIQLWLGSYKVVAMILIITDKSYRYGGKLKRTNFREIASFLMFLHLITMYAKF